MTFLERLDATNGSGGPDCHWRFGDAPGATMAARIGGVNGAWANITDLEFQADPLTANAAGGKSIAFGAAGTDPGHGTITLGTGGVTVAGQHTFHMRVQLDAAAAKYQVLTNDGASAAGSFAREFVDDGAGGMTPRMYTRDAGAAPVVYVGSALSTVPIGESFGVDWIQENGSLRCRINGVEIAMTLASGTPPASWPAPPDSTMYVGMWPSAITPVDGLMSELALWNSILSLSDSQSLNIPRNVVWLRNIDAGQVEVNQTKTISLAPHANPASGFTPIVGQGSLGAAAVNGEEIEYTAGGTAGNDDAFTVKVDKGGIDSPTRTVTIDVVDALAGADAPFFGKYFGDDTVNISASNTRLDASSTQGVSDFFYAERTGTVTHIRQQWRAGGQDSGYSDGDGGIHTVEIRKADPVTKLPLTGGSDLICQMTGYDADVNNTVWSTHAFTITGQVIAKQPYCIVWRNTHTDRLNNYVSENRSRQFRTTATFPNPPINGWVPIADIPGISGEFKPYATLGDNGAIKDTFIGMGHWNIRYSDGQWTGVGGPGQHSDNEFNITGNNMARHRFRPWRTHSVSGVWIHLSRRNASGGSVVVTLESGPASLSSGNGTQIEQHSVAASNFFNSGTRTAWNFELDHVNWVWVPFTQNRTLNSGSIYTIRLSASGGFDGLLNRPHRGDHSNINWSPLHDDFDTHQANQTLSWSSWEYSLGLQISTDGGSNWSFSGGNNRSSCPLLFKCV